MSLRKIMEEIIEGKPEIPAAQNTQDEAIQPLGPRKGFEELSEKLIGETPKTQGDQPQNRDNGPA